MTTAKWTSIQERSRIHAILMQDLMKRGVCSCGAGDGLTICYAIEGMDDLFNNQIK
jgi:hypothetical protein